MARSIGKPGFFPPARSHGDDAYAEHANDVCPSCQTRIHKGDEVRWDMRATTRGGGFAMPIGGRWVHWDCFDATAWRRTRR